VPRDRVSDSSLSADALEVLEAHRAAGRRFDAGGVRSFVRERGDARNNPVVLVHGVPTSSFLYRKLIPALEDEGVRSLAFDLPGLGLAGRPEDFDYTWSGLAGWFGMALEALEVDRCHLVVHDIGGPVALEWALANREHVQSLTVLNTMLDPGDFKRPWVMAPYARRGLGAMWLRATPLAAFVPLFRSQGVADRKAISSAEIEVYRHLVRREDNGRAFLRIMRGFDLSEARSRALAAGLGPDRGFPARIVWGELDTALGLDQLAVAQRVTGIEEPTRLPAKHFLQEDFAPAIAQVVADLVAPLG
jgi:pimeloyl-ACP methyl ester carboxylesterase